MSSYDKLKNDFQKLIENNNLSHAYLIFGGSPDVHKNKLLFFEALANFLETGNWAKPAHPLIDLLIIRRIEEGTIGIDAARSLKQFLYRKPIVSRNRTAIIDDSGFLTPEAQNSILKIVEEPPASSLIIFISQNEHDLLPTLVSRLQKIYFNSSLDGGGVRNPSVMILLDSLLSNPEISEAEIDEAFKSLIIELRSDKERNLNRLKETLRRLQFIKQYNTNKRLQLNALLSFLRKSDY